MLFCSAAGPLISKQVKIGESIWNYQTMAHSVTSSHSKSRMAKFFFVTFKEECAQILQLLQTPLKSGQSNWNPFVTPVFNLIFPAITGYFTKDFEFKKFFELKKTKPQTKKQLQ